MKSEWLVNHTKFQEYRTQPASPRLRLKILSVTLRGITSENMLYICTGSVRKGINLV